MDMFDYLIAGMFGAVLGSFANVCINSGIALEDDESLLKGSDGHFHGRSRCMSCQDIQLRMESTK